MCGYITSTAMCGYITSTAMCGCIISTTMCGYCYFYNSVWITYSIFDVVAIHSGKV